MMLKKSILAAFCLSASALFISTAYGACAAQWYQGKWNCQLGKSPMSLDIYYDGASECSLSARAKMGASPVVNMSIAAASGRSVELRDDAGTLFHLERVSNAANSDAKGTGTIDAIADPLSCSHGSPRPEGKIERRACPGCPATKLNR